MKRILTDIINGIKAIPPHITILCAYTSILFFICIHSH